MAFSASSIFTQFLAGAMDRTITYDLDGTTHNVALFNNSVVPDKDAVAGSIGYNTGTWTTTNEVSQTTTWPAGGRPLVNADIATAAGVVYFDGDDTVSNGNATLSNAYGAMVYDNNLAGKNGISYNAFGGAQSVTNGQLTVQWHSNGIWRATIS